MDEKVNPDGTVSQSFMSATAERVVGYIPNDADVRIDNIDGVDWIVAEAIIFGWYAPELAERLKGTGTLSDSEKRERAMRVSIETLIDEGYKQDDGTEVFERYRVLGTTILSDDTLEAVAGANIRALSAIGVDRLRDITRLRVASANKQSLAANQQTKTNKEKKKSMITVKELQKFLPDYKVLAVNGDMAALASADYATIYSCSVNMDNGEIVVGAKNPVDKVSINDGDSCVEIETDKVVGELQAKCSQVEADLAAEKDAREKAENEIKKMREKENERRCQAVKNAIENRLSEINANRATKIEESVVAELKTDKAISAYAAMEDGEGNFVGENAARRDVDHRCMNMVLQQEAQRANAAKSRFAWEIGKAGEETTDGGVFAAAKRIKESK